ncbi:MAG: hypothetical protein K6B28_13370, partial [Lachnospiraceae bacterium]|nr:hypothetical protein [Lachnospiraceae bacterium]
GTQGAGRAQCEDYYSPLIGDYYKIFNKESEYGLRAPYEFYYEVNDKFDTLDINNAYYAFYEMIDGYDHPGLVFLKKTDKGDCIYSAYTPGGCIMNYRGGSPDEKEGEELYFYDKGTIAFVRNVDGYEYISYFRPYFEGEYDFYKFILTLVKKEYDSGQYRYYISYDRESGEDFSSHDYNIYMDSTKEEYDEIRSKYEKPAEIEKIPLTEFAGE